MVRMQEWDCCYFTQVLHLVFDAQRLLDEILVAVAGYFLVQVLEDG